MAEYIDVIRQMSEKKIIKILNSALAQDPYHKRDFDIRRQFPRHGMINREIEAVRHRMDEEKEAKRKAAEASNSSNSNPPVPQRAAPPLSSISQANLREIVKGAFLGAYSEELEIPRSYLDARMKDISTFTTYFLRVDIPAHMEIVSAFNRDLEARKTYIIDITSKYASLGDGELATIAKEKQNEMRAKLEVNSNEPENAHLVNVQSAIESMAQNPSWLHDLIIVAYAAIDYALMHASKGECDNSSTSPTISLEKCVQLERELVFLIIRARVTILLPEQAAKKMLDEVDKAYEKTFRSARTAIVMHDQNMSKAEKKKMDANVMKRLNESP